MSETLPIDIHNKVVIEIADTIEQQKKDLDKLYGDKIIELCKNNPSTKVYTGINTIYNNVFGETKLKDYPQNPSYWYDYNKGKFIPAINMYQGKIFKTINFQIYNSEYIFHNESTYKTYLEAPFNLFFTNNHNQRTYTYDAGFKALSPASPINTVQDINKYKLNVEKYMQNTNISISIDDHLNIYLPQYNIIIIRNYSSFSFGSIDNIFDMHHIRVYNNKNDDDKTLCQYIQSFIQTMAKIGSNDERNKMNNDLFNTLFNFIEYDTKLNKIKKNITYIDTLISQGCSQPVQEELNNIKIKLADTIKELTYTKEKLQSTTEKYESELKKLKDEHIVEIASKEDELCEMNHKLKKTKEELEKYVNIIVPDMSPEQMKCKIQNLEKTIMTLENDLSTYKGEISVYKQYYDTRQK